MAILFQWDNDKARANAAKHGVSFDEATTVFSDPLSMTVLDPDHSVSEDRFVILGHSHRPRLLVVIFTERGNTIRIISARCASKTERQMYENQK